MIRIELIYRNSNMSLQKTDENKNGISMSYLGWNTAIIIFYPRQNPKSYPCHLGEDIFLFYNSFSLIAMSQAALPIYMHMCGQVRFINSANLDLHS